MAIPLLMIGGAVLSGIGELQQGKAAKTAALYNAAQAEQSAQLALDQSEADAQRFHTAYRKHEGSMLAEAGGSGLSGGTESILADSAMSARLDEELIRYKGKVQATGYYNAATLDRFSGQNAEEQSQLKSASQILSGVGHAGVVQATTTSRLRQGPARSSMGYESTDFYDDGAL